MRLKNINFCPKVLGIMKQISNCGQKPWVGALSSGFVLIAPRDVLISGPIRLLRAHPLLRGGVCQPHCPDAVSVSLNATGVRGCLRVRRLTRVCRLPPSPPELPAAQYVQATHLRPFHEVEKLRLHS